MAKDKEYVPVSFRVKRTDVLTMEALRYLEEDAPGRVNISDICRQGIRDEAARRRATGVGCQTDDTI